MTPAKNITASVHARLLNQAHALQADFNFILTRYALERLLYRLSVSAYSDDFLLKGALLFDMWFDHPQRPTRDIDLLGFGPADLHDLTTMFKDICAVPCVDGMTYDLATVRAAAIRKDANYGGVRVTMLGRLDGARCHVQVDVGYGDAVTPAAEKMTFPVLLDDMPPPQLRTYPVYSVVAEKYQAIASLGIANTRMKDYFDLWILAQHAVIDRDVLAQAIAATFERRGTSVPEMAPLGLSPTFANDLLKQRQWRAFLSKNHLVAPELPEVAKVVWSLVSL